LWSPRLETSALKGFPPEIGRKDLSREMKIDNESDFEIRFEERAGYFYAFVFGKQDSLAISLAYWQKAIDECTQRGYDRLLVEEEFPNQISPREIYTLIVEIRKMLTTPMRIVFMDRAAEHSELNLFGENVAVNRGIVGRVYSKIKDAEEWLRSS
jgi:hypothetical protein